MSDYSKLQELAEAATKGPWGYDGSYVCPARTEDGTTYVESWRSVADCAQPENTKFIAAANPATVLELIAESKRLAKKLDHNDYYCATRFETLFHWAHRVLDEPQKNEYFSIVANGSSYPDDPPTYAQQMNRLKWKVEAAEKERDMLKVEIERLRTAEGDAMTYKAGMENVAQQRDQFKVENGKFDEGMRSMACSLGAGGYNAETLTADQLVDKVQWGLTNLADSSAKLLDQVRAERDQLNTENERLRKLPTCWSEVLEQSEANDQLLDKVLELSRDAERYRWLRTQNIPLNGHDFLSSHEILDRRVDAKIVNGADQ